MTSELPRLQYDKKSDGKGEQRGLFNFPKKATPVSLSKNIYELLGSLPIYVLKDWCRSQGGNFEAHNFLSPGVVSAAQDRPLGSIHILQNLLQGTGIKKYHFLLTFSTMYVKSNLSVVLNSRQYQSVNAQFIPLCVFHFLVKVTKTEKISCQFYSSLKRFHFAQKRSRFSYK